MTAVLHPHTPFGFETAPGENQVTQGHTRQEGGDVIPLDC